MRRSMVMMNVLMAPVGQLGPVFGQIADHIDENGITAFGQTSRAYGFQISFAVCAVTILLGMALAWVWLPRSPDDSENARQ